MAPMAWVKLPVCVWACAVWFRPSNRAGVGTTAGLSLEMVVLSTCAQKKVLLESMKDKCNANATRLRVVAL